MLQSRMRTYAFGVRVSGFIFALDAYETGVIGAKVLVFLSLLFRVVDLARTRGP